MTTRIPTAVLALAICLVASTSSFAQHTATRSIVVPLGQASDVSFAMAVQNDPTVADEKVCTATKLTTKTLVIVGKSLGTTNLFVVLDAGIESVAVEVVRDPTRFQRLEATIPTVVPGAEITLTTVDSTDKVLVRGTVKSWGDIKLIMDLLEDSQLAASQIINQVSVKCCCPCRTTCGRRIFCSRSS